MVPSDVSSCPTDIKVTGSVWFGQVDARCTCTLHANGTSFRLHFARDFACCGCKLNGYVIRLLSLRTRGKRTNRHDLGRQEIHYAVEGIKAEGPGNGRA